MEGHSYHLALFAVRVSWYLLRWIQNDAKLSEKSAGELVTVDKFELARVDGQRVTDVEVFHGVELTVGGARTLNPVTSNDRSFITAQSTLAAFV